MGCSGGSCSSCSSCSTDDRKDDNELPPGMLDRYDLDQSTANGALVWIEVLRCPDGPRISDASLQILEAVCSMNEGRTFAVIFGGPELKTLYPNIFGCGVGTVYHVRDKDSECYDSNRYSVTLCDIVDRVVPAFVVMAATERGGQIAEKMASMLSVNIYKGCEKIHLEGRNLRTEPADMNQFLMPNKKTFPQIATVIPGSYPDPDKKEGKGTAIYWQTRGSF